METSPPFARPKRNTAFNIAFGIDAIALLVSLYFIVTDSINFTSSDNTGLTVITVLFAGWMGFCWYLKSKGSVAGTILAWIPAVPLLLYGLFILMFIILSPDVR